MTKEILLCEVYEGDIIRIGIEWREVKDIDVSDLDMGECGDPECCGSFTYYDVTFTDGTTYWGHENTSVDKLV